MVSLRLAAAGAVGAALATLTRATDPQSIYPACPINSVGTTTFCCDYGGDKAIYTSFKRPTGGDYGKFYEEGWKKARQINWVKPPDVVSMYKPDAPEFVFGDKQKTCRMVMIANKGKLDLPEMQCNFVDKRVVLNTSLVSDADFDAAIYLTTKANPRNNNASFPLGASCVPITSDEQRKNCTSGGFNDKYYYTTGKETELVVLYVLYAVFFGVLLLWTLARMMLSANTSSSSATERSLEEGSKKLLENRGGPTTPGLVKGPSLAMRETEVRLRNSVEDIVQTGYTSSAVGMAILIYLVLLTLLMQVLVIILILDNQFKFVHLPEYTNLFDPNNVLIKVFIALWSICSIWLGFIVLYEQKIQNFFRMPASLAQATRVRLFKPENTETLLADRTGISQFVQRVEKFIFPYHQDGVEQTVSVHTTSEGTRYIEFQHLRYTFDEEENRFIPGSVVLPDTLDQIVADAKGLTDAEHERRLDIVGRNAISLEMPSWLRSIVDEFFAVFYVYQLMVYYVWYYTDYKWVAALNLVVIVLSAAVNIYTKRSMLSSIVTMTQYQTDVEVFRNDKWKTVESGDLVPGDLVRISENWELPCDLVIVKGSTICDESMLTGESMPVQKFPVPVDSKAVYVAEGAGKKHTLFSGTKTIASGRNEELLAVVQSTGAHTNRGQLVQSILYPAPMKFKYDEHLKAVVGFLFFFAFLAAYLAMKFLISNAGVANYYFSFVYGMFMFSAVLNPLLPVVITIGQVNAARRLIRKSIFCLNPHRITLAGKVRVFCFDKTGTITKQGLDYRSVVPVVDGAFLPEELDSTSSTLAPLVKYALASCHAVGTMNGTLVGNEVEVKMFESTKWSLIESEGSMPVVKSADGSEVLQVVKRFEFDHHRMSMSVIMKHQETGKLYVFCKGSYEKMQSVSTPASVPANYKEFADNLAKDGCYVLGVAFKEVSEMTEEQMHAFLADRDAVEAGLSLLGLLNFRNELKEDSRDAILKLKAGDVRTVMITGDNAMTGCYIARASGMVDADARVVLGDMLESGLVWKDVDTQEVYAHDQISFLADEAELAVTGKAFDHLVKMGEIEQLLLKIRIFSRMTPAGKVECVRLHIASGAVTGMCGDGGNDCGALRIAHVGIALSEAEASVVSPFTSKTKSLESVVDVIIEGRGALATSFGSVKYLLMYGLIGIGCRFVMYYNGVFISQFGFMYLDGAIMVGLSYAITRAKPLPSLGTQRPTSSLVGPTTLVSLVGSEVIHAIFLYCGIHYVMTRPWYCPFQSADVNLVQWWLLQDSNLGTSLWIIICFQQMSTGLTMSIGSRFRQAFWKNKFLMVYYAVLFILLAIMFLGPPTRLSDQFRVASSTNVVGLPDIPLPTSFRWEIFALGVGNTVAVMLFEKVIVQGKVRDFFRAKYHKDIIQFKL
jgi:predicted P-type ATPase